MEATSALPEAALPLSANGNYNPVTVTVNDSVGAAFLGVVALALLVAFLRAEAGRRAALARLAEAR